MIEETTYRGIRGYSISGGLELVQQFVGGLHRIM